MARVSRRCQSCADAHIQCDGRTPCARCKSLKTKTPCQRHVRSFVFRDEGPALQEKYSDDGAQSQRTPAEYQSITLPIDTPSLAVTAISSLQTQVFTNFVLSAFPCLFKCTETQVPVTWIEYVDKRSGTNSSFDWILRACNTSFTGALYKDDRLLHEARNMYTRALHSLNNLLRKASTARSDEALATAISLAFYEKHHCTDDAWLKHASGIRTLMQLRGPSAHLHGFGRAMYMTYRSFLVTSALISGEACFLERPEWQALNKQIAATIAKLPDSSLYTDVVERGFLEVLKIPGFVKQVRESLLLPGVEMQMSLLRNMEATRATLRGLLTEFGVSASMRRTESLVGPLPYCFLDGYSSLYASGIRSSLVILNQLILAMDPSQREAVEADNRVLAGVELGPRAVSNLLTPPDSPRCPRLVVESLITPAYRKPPTTDWMDHIAATMGMDGVRVELLE
ncbi:hypothetical protein BDV25DRAFT_53118 [Aspergillus avenaceus]|uniref:Zn(2)-C6 fungal-type domain-containing protein n=1 Tax=Aspergillus avenaceus TaxID=36643 RepID=A0A5N6U2T5_ASPAV|nr:hypothetical protein BDV25DRAFT_53118 [Aspergillus avenaceus]